MTWTKVQSTTYTTVASGSPSNAFAASPTVGNLVVAYVTNLTSAVQPLEVIDGGSTFAYTCLGSAINTGASIGTFIYAAIQPGSPYGDTKTVIPVLSGASFSVATEEWSGVPAGAKLVVLDSTSGTSGPAATTTSGTSGAVTTSLSGELILSGIGLAGNVTSPAITASGTSPDTSAYSLGETASRAFNGHVTSGATGTYNPHMSWTTSKAWAQTTVAVPATTSKPPTFAAISYGNTGSAASVTINVGNPGNTGSIPGALILIWGYAGSSGTTLSCPGFTAVTVTSATSSTLQLLWRIADGTEGTSFTVTLSTAKIAAIACATYTGVNTSNPFDPAPTNSGQANTGSTIITSNSFTTTQPYDAIAWFAGVDAASGATPGTITVPSGFIQPYGPPYQQSNTTSSSGTNVGVAFATATKIIAGTQGPSNGSQPGSHANGAGMFAIQGVAASVSASVSAGFAGVTVTGSAPTTTTSGIPTTASVTALGFVPTVSITSGGSVAPVAGGASVTASGFNPTVTKTLTGFPTVATVTVSGFNPHVTVPSGPSVAAQAGFPSANDTTDGGSASIPSLPITTGGSAVPGFNYNDDGGNALQPPWAAVAGAFNPLVATNITAGAASVGVTSGSVAATGTGSVVPSGASVATQSFAPIPTTGATDNGMAVASVAAYNPSVITGVVGLAGSASVGVTSFGPSVSLVGSPLTANVSVVTFNAGNAPSAAPTAGSVTTTAAQPVAGLIVPAGFPIAAGFTTDCGAASVSFGASVDAGAASVLFTNNTDAGDAGAPPTSVVVGAYNATIAGGSQPVPAVAVASVSASQAVSGITAFPTNTLYGGNAAQTGPQSVVGGNASSGVGSPDLYGGNAFVPPQLVYTTAYNPIVTTVSNTIGTGGASVTALQPSVGLVAIPSVANVNAAAFPAAITTTTPPATNVQAQPAFVTAVGYNDAAASIAFTSGSASVGVTSASVGITTSAAPNAASVTATAYQVTEGLVFTAGSASVGVTGYQTQSPSVGAVGATASVTATAYSTTPSSLWTAGSASIGVTSPAVTTTVGVTGSASVGVTANQPNLTVPVVASPASVAAAAYNPVVSISASTGAASVGVGSGTVFTSVTTSAGLSSVIVSTFGASVVTGSNAAASAGPAQVQVTSANTALTVTAQPTTATVAPTGVDLVGTVYATAGLGSVILAGYEPSIQSQVNTTASAGVASVSTNANGITVLNRVVVFGAGRPIPVWISTQSTQFVRVPIFTKPEANLVNDPVRMAFIGPFASTQQAADYPADESSVWKLASWDPLLTNTARCLVGPSGVPLKSGSYQVWVRVTDSPEQAIIWSGPLVVQ